MSDRSGDLSVILTDRDQTLFTVDDCFGVIFHVETTLPGITAMSRAMSAFVDRRGPNVGLLTVVEDRAPLPSSAARQALAVFMQTNTQAIRTSAVVFEGEGFRAAAVRSVVTGLSMLARHPFPHKTFGSVTDAVLWMLGRPLGDKAVVERVAAIEAARRHGSPARAATVGSAASAAR